MWGQIPGLKDYHYRRSLDDLRNLKTLQLYCNRFIGPSYRLDNVPLSQMYKEYKTKSKAMSLNRYILSHDCTSRHLRYALITRDCSYDCGSEGERCKELTLKRPSRLRPLGADVKFARTVQLRFTGCDIVMDVRSGEIQQVMLISGYAGSTTALFP